MRETIEGWPGYVHRQKDGRPLFIIEKQVTVPDGKGGTVRHRFHVSTRAHSLKPALEQLKRFEGDPFAYNPVGGDLRAPLMLTTDMATSLHDWQIANGRSAKYAREVFTWLKRWGKALRGLNLRRLNIARDVLPVLDEAGGARRPLMAALKTLFSWLRTERHELTSAEDPTRDLRLPKTTAAKHRERQVVDIGRVRKASKHLDGAYLDALLFQMGTAAHITELERFIRDARSQLVVLPRAKRLADGSKCLAVVMLWHKTKKWHRIPLTQRQTVEAAQRLRARGSVPKDLNGHLYAACDRAGVPQFSYKLRHSVLTWGRKRGASREAAAEFAGHESMSTQEVYVDLDLPPSAIPVERL